MRIADPGGPFIPGARCGGPRITKGKETTLAYQPYVPEKTDQREFTLRAILIDQFFPELVHKED